jgi:hypothetical protein
MLPPSDFQICSWRNTCIPLNSTKTLSIDPPYGDPGTDLAYYNYAPGGGASAIASEPQGGCTATSGYHITYTGTSFTLTTTKPLWLSAQNELYFAFAYQNGCVSDPIGMKITMTAKGSDGKTYINSGANTYQAGSDFPVYMNSVSHGTPMVALKISVTGAPAGGTLDLAAIYNEDYY